MPSPEKGGFQSFKEGVVIGAEYVALGIAIIAGLTAEFPVVALGLLGVIAAEQVRKRMSST